MSREKELKTKDKEVFCKLFVGNLKFSTTTEDLRDFYQQFGEIVDCVVMKDGHGKSRGFGFVTYKDPESIDIAQKSRPHFIGGRKTESKRAIPRGEADKPEAQQNINKIFIGGLLEEVNEAELEDHFGKYGKIANTNVIRDSVTGKKRGFAYITFEDYDSVDKIVLEKFHTLGGKTSEVRKALSKEEMRKINSKGKKRDRGDDYDDYRGGMGSGNNNNMMMSNMPGNFMGGPMGGGGSGGGSSNGNGSNMFDDFMNNSNGGGMNNPFDMLANMGMMGQMMGMMNGMGGMNTPMGPGQPNMMNSMMGNGSGYGPGMLGPGGFDMNSMLGTNSSAGLGGGGMNDSMSSAGGFNSNFAPSFNRAGMPGGFGGGGNQGMNSNQGMKNTGGGSGRDRGSSNFGGKRGGGGRF